MSTLKDVLSLLAILVAYGIVGRMDHDDAVMLEAAQPAVVERSVIGCDAEPGDSMPESVAQARQMTPGALGESAPCWQPSDLAVIE
ncbi:MAG: hypothetical protein KDG44_10950 [Burkholderiaceae bacterium]|jgi:hypothetical protein|nr:hypothetical protein [Burkholderiaceae bacterium]